MTVLKNLTFQMTHSVAKLSNLKLDPYNPRFENSFSEDVNLLTIIKELFKESDVSSIITSIVQQEFDFVEPIVVTKDNDGKWLVLEGNRRTAAFMICAIPEYAKEVGLNIEGVMNSNFELPIYIYESRQAAQKYLHKRHVSKPHGWKPYAKNQFLYKSYIGIEEKKFHRNSIEKLGKDYDITIPNIYSALVSYLVFEEIKKYDFFYLPVDAKKVDYSVFTTALSNPSIRDFLGLERDLNQYHDVPFIDLKKRINLDSLRVFTTIVFDKSYGKNSNKAILDDSRKVTKLGEIFDCEQAVQELLKTKNIDEVYLNLSKIRLTSSNPAGSSSNPAGSSSNPAGSSSNPAGSSSNPAGSSSIDIRPFKPFFSAHVSKKISGLYKKFMESVDKKEAADNVIPFIDYLSKFRK